MANIFVTSVIAVALPAAALIGGGSLMAHVAPREAPAEQRLLSRWRGYSFDEVRAYWSAFQRPGLEAERRFLEVDLVFPFIYGGAFLSSMLLLRVALGRPFSPAIPVATVATMMAADWTENLVHLAQISRILDPEAGSDTFRQSWIALASTATSIKWVLIGASGIAIVLLVVALFARNAR